MSIRHRYRDAVSSVVPLETSIEFVRGEGSYLYDRNGSNRSWWGHDHERLHPDLMILAKGLSSGYSPLGAVVAQTRVWKTIHDGTGRFAHGLTYEGNPVSAAAGVAVMELMDAEHWSSMLGN